MGKSYWVRLAMMVFALAAVIAGIRFFNPPQDNPHSAGGKSFAPLPAPRGTFNLCPSRIAWLQTSPAGARIEEFESKWFRIENGQRGEVDAIAVEKWLSIFCSALTREATPNAAGANEQNLAMALQIGYVSGATQALMRAQSTGEFQLQGHHFTSKEVDESLRTLPNLPPAHSPGTP